MNYRERVKLVVDGILSGEVPGTSSYREYNLRDSGSTGLGEGEPQCPPGGDAPQDVGGRRGGEPRRGGDLRRGGEPLRGANKVRWLDSSRRICLHVCKCCRRVILTRG